LKIKIGIIFWEGFELVSRRLYERKILIKFVNYFLILILIASSSIVISQSAFAYHVEREQMEISQMTGIFNSQMNMIMHPKIGQDYHLQVVLRDESQYANSTVTVGYGFNLMERVPNKLTPDSEKPFMGFESRHSTASIRDSKTIHTGEHKFPIIVNFTVSFEKPGVHQYSYFENRVDPPGSSGSNGGGYHVVSEYSKAIGENGVCKNSELLTLAKHDFSTLVCVTQETHHELITRGWAPLPG